LGAEPAADLASIPPMAAARLDFQLVPRQHPQAVAALLEQHLADKGLADVAVERLAGGYPSASTAFDHPFSQRLSAAGRHVYGEPLHLLPRGPFARPAFFLAESFSMPIGAVACGRLGDGSGAANEHVALPDLVRYGQLLIELIYATAQAAS
jgi:acetylornithine deacetylase/succinyl-diaminopimelate desuccinylase-like protein